MEIMYGSWSACIGCIGRKQSGIAHLWDFEWIQSFLFIKHRLSSNDGVETFLSFRMGEKWKSNILDG